MIWVEEVGGVKDWVIVWILLVRLMVFVCWKLIEGMGNVVKKFNLCYFSLCGL